MKVSFAAASALSVIERVIAFAIPAMRGANVMAELLTTPTACTLVTLVASTGPSAASEAIRSVRLPYGMPADGGTRPAADATSISTPSVAAFAPFAVKIKVAAASFHVADAANAPAPIETDTEESPPRENPLSVRVTVSPLAIEN